MSGTLALVTTPIGNLGEVCPRSFETIQNADVIYCENTQKALKLLTHLSIMGKPLKAAHEANEGRLAAEVADKVEAGKQVVYMSEAGVPTICDPGFRLVRECRKRDLRVEAIGIPCAFVNALAISGLPSDAFGFYGFPPPKTVGRQKLFASATASEQTAIFYESTHRIQKSLNDLREVLEPERLVCLCGELTKLHESSTTAPISELAVPTNPKGEWVIVVAKAGYTL